MVQLLRIRPSVIVIPALARPAAERRCYSSTASERTLLDTGVERNWPIVSLIALLGGPVSVDEEANYKNNKEWKGSPERVRGSTCFCSCHGKGQVANLQQ